MRTPRTLAAVVMAVATGAVPGVVGSDSATARGVDTAPAGDPSTKVPHRKTIATPASFRDNGITAHRGFSGGHPENTLESLQAGIDSGADWIETDVHSTKDGVLVVLHDTTTGRTAGIDRTVRESTWEELKSLDVNRSGCRCCRRFSTSLPSSTRLACNSSRRTSPRPLPRSKWCRSEACRLTSGSTTATSPR